MASQKQYRKKWLRWHKQYEKYAEEQLMDLFKKWIGKIDFKRSTPDNFKEIIKAVINRDDVEDAYYKIYSKIGRTHGKRIGDGINIEAKEFEYVSFLDVFIKNIMDIIKNGVQGRITTVEDSFFETIVNIMYQRYINNKTVSDAARDIEKAINKKTFYRWQAMRIARTEATAAANYAAYMAGQNTGFVMEKIWISSQDKRTRVIPEDHYDHYHMNNVKQQLNEPFNVKELDGTHDKLMYPGDPQGEAGNVINCRCALAVRPKRDKEGNLIRTNK